MGKKVLLAVFCFFLLAAVQAQNGSGAATRDTVLGDIVTANNLKSGNWQDVLSNFFQIAASNLTGPKKTFSFQSTLFAVKTKTDSSLFVDTNYVRHTFDRNFQFGFTLGLDSNYQFNGFSAGVTWAAVNKRDSTVLSLVGTKADVYFKQFADSMTIVLRLYRKQLVDSNGEFVSADASARYSAAKNALNKILAADSTFDVGKLPADFQTFLKTHQFPTSSYDLALGLYRKALRDLRVKPLLTFSLLSAFTKAAGFDSAQLGLVYLQGMTRSGKNLELDLRGKFVVKDSTVGGDRYRSRFDGSGGFDYALISSRDPKSGIYNPIFEVKPYFEYHHIFSALLAGEQRDQVFAAVDLRLKITNNLWIPVTLKYGLTGKKNFLGFLNLSFNMNSFKSSLKKGG